MPGEQIQGQHQQIEVQELVNVPLGRSLACLVPHLHGRKPTDIYKRAVVCSSEHNCCWQVFHPRRRGRSVARNGAGGAFWVLRDWISLSVQHRVAAALGFNAEGKRWTPNSLALMHESSNMGYCFLSGVVLHLWVVDFFWTTVGAGETSSCLSLGKCSHLSCICLIIEKLVSVIKCTMNFNFIEASFQLWK